MQRTALVLVDLQKDFFDQRNQSVGRLQKAIGIPATRRLLEHAREMDWRIAHVISIHTGAESLPVHLQRSGLDPYCLEGSEGAGIVAGLREEGEAIVRKRGYNGFAERELVDYLEESRSVVIAGIAADCCILATALDAASTHSKHVYLPYQAISASNLEAYVFGLEAAAKSAGAVLDINNLLDGNEPHWELRIDPASVTHTLESWFKPRLEAVESLRATRPNLSTMAVTDALEILEQELCGFA